MSLLPSISSSVRLSLFFLIGLGLIVVSCDSGGSNTSDPPTPPGEDDPPSTGNEAPTAQVDVDPAPEVDVGTEVTLDGSGSSDPDGDDLTYSWSLTAPSGSDAALSDRSAAAPTFTPDQSGSYTATLEVSDGDASDTDDASLTAEQAVITIGSDIRQDRTLRSGSTYRIVPPERIGSSLPVPAQILAVRDEATLTIEPGAEIRFTEEAALRTDEGGSLVAEGTDADPIVMSATPGNEDPGSWKGLQLTSGENILRHVQIRHTGFGVAVDQDRAFATLPPDREESRHAAIFTGRVEDDASSAPRLTIEESTLESGRGPALRFGPGADLASVSGTTFEGFPRPTIDRLPAEATAGDPPAFDGTNQFSEGATAIPNALFARGEDKTLAPLPNSSNLTYLSPSFDVYNRSLTIEPGVHLEMYPAEVASVSGDGTLQAEGTADRPIVLASTADDSASGESESSDWGGLLIDKSDVTLEHVQLRDAYQEVSDFTPGSIVLYETFGGQARLTINDITIEDGGYHGICLGEEGTTLNRNGDNTFDVPGQPVTVCQ
jgi:hypothetical protein